ncbi:hypothetical protein [Flagellimonas sp. S3867]|uniref:hypothetical protein n=1 Tax=Flagellimonas sp. S3867 TaxID=2768063 RepID=UPI001684D5AC|nr:hypothetical protein [Flagellimonas sp. S3867]
MYPKFRILCLFLIIGGILHGQNSVKKGKVQDSVLVSGTTDQTFALYLPESYNQNQLNSIVFIFEPAGRGVIGVRPFISASEKYGHVLVCSNNAKNGPYERNFDIANKLFNHIFSNFNIKESEMYLSGFSGGSRLASSIASLTNKFAGVIGCGAGFSYSHEQMPAAHQYSYVGLCGDRDMNYREMLENKDYLKLIKFNSTLITYDGEHRWPPPEQILRAFEWLQLQKLKKEDSATDKILHQYHADHTLFRQFKKNQTLLFASEQSERMLQDYKGFIEIDSLVKQHKQLQKSRAYKKQVASLDAALKTEVKLASKLQSQLSEDFAHPHKVNFSWWQKEFSKLDALRKNEDQEVQKMAFRVKFDLFARIYSRKNNLMYTQNEELTVLVNRFMDLLRASSN